MKNQKGFIHIAAGLALVAIGGIIGAFVCYVGHLPR